MSAIAEHLLSEVAKAREILDGIDEQIRAVDQDGAWDPKPMDPVLDETIDRIIDVVCERRACSRSLMMSDDKRIRAVDPRHIAMYVVWALTNVTHSALGKKFGGRCNATAIEALRRVKRLVETEPNFRADVTDAHIWAAGVLGLKTVRRMENVP